VSVHTRPHRLIERDASPGSAVLSRDESQSICDRSMKLSKADTIEVQINSNFTGNTRFAANQMSTSGSVANVQLAIQSSYGPKHAVVLTNDLSDESIQRAVAESERLAKLAPDDPEAMPPLGAQTYQQVDAYFDSTGDLTPGDRAKVALHALGLARGAGDLLASGFLITGATSVAESNNKGLFAYWRSTSANYQITVRTTDGSGSGWAAADNQDWAHLDFKSVAERATEKAKLSRKPEAIEPGRYTVIFEPQAAGDLIQLIGNYSDARSADEGRSPFSRPAPAKSDSAAKAGPPPNLSKVGEKIMDERVTIFADPRDPQLLSQPFDGDGLPLGRQVFIDKGVLQQLFYSRYWAKKMGKEATGNPQSIKMAGGSGTIDDLIAATPRGVLVTRLWYLREVDPRTILYTGLTRDGTFLIENGKISKAVRNFRFNDSPLFMLNNLEGLATPQRIAGTEQGGDIVMPAVKVKDFNFTSLSDAV
jgi:predicted Zn-dependent protease